MKLRILVNFWDCKCNDTCVNEIVNKFKTSQANISQHLSGLKDMNIIVSKKDSRRRIYSINKDVRKTFDSLFKEIILHDDLNKWLCKCQNPEVS
ncbi:ArsR family transcriptional regulator [[Mycoplasma] mobile]|nr:ArsR family transcriptional regulator [[Mycoplasma] mobile]